MAGIVDAFKDGVMIEQGIRQGQQRQEQFEQQKEAFAQQQARNQKIDEHLDKLRPLELERAQRQNAYDKQVDPYRKTAAKNAADLSQMQFDDAVTKRNISTAKNLFPMVKQELAATNGDLAAVARKYPAYFEATKGMNNALNFEFALKPETTRAYQVMKQIVNPNTPESFAKSPEALSAVNTLLADQVKRGGGNNPSTGLPIVDRKIVGIYQNPKNPKQLAFELEVTDEGGNKYIAPRTENASSDPDDPIKMVDVESLLDQLFVGEQLTRQVQATAQQNPQFSEQVKFAYDTEALNQQLALAEKQFMPSSKKQLKAGYVPWGETSLAIGDVVSMYEKSLPDPDTNPDLYELHRNAMPFDYFRWAQGDPQKMQFVRKAKEVNVNLYREYAKAMSEASEDGDYAAMGKADKQFLSKLQNPIQNWNEAQGQGNNPQPNAGDTKQPVPKQGGLSDLGNGGMPAPSNLPEKPAQPLSFEEWDNLIDSSRSSQEVFNRASLAGSFVGLSGAPVNVHQQTTKEQRYKHYLKSIEYAHANYERSVQKQLDDESEKKQQALRNKISWYQSRLKFDSTTQEDKDELQSLLTQLDAERSAMELRHLELAKKKSAAESQSGTDDESGFFSGLASLFGFDDEEKPSAQASQTPPSDTQSAPARQGGLIDVNDVNSPYHESKITRSQSQALMLYERGYSKEQAIQQIKALKMAEPNEKRLIQEISDVYQYAEQRAQTAGLAQYASNSNSK